jgi:hypothetical protein
MEASNEQTQHERTEELEEAGRFREESERIRDLADVEPTPSLEKICREIIRGRYDGEFDRIMEAMDARRSQRKAEVFAQVQEVFGPEARISFGEKSEPPAEERPTEDNPFVRVAAEAARAVRNDEIELRADDEVVDPLADSESDVERQMVDEGKIENLPIEQRGAIIGGLSSSQIAD